MTAPKRTRPAVNIRVVSVEMADGTPMTSPEAQVRIARALLGGGVKGRAA